MAASKESVIVLGQAQVKFRDLVENALADERVQKLKPRLEIANETTALLRIGTNWRSWGERISVMCEPASIRITSECSFPLQFIDWGKNRTNVNALRQALSQAIHAST